MNEDSEIVVCGRSDRCVQGGGGIASRVSYDFLLFVEVMDRLRDEVRQESAHDTVTV